jgi:hypothetical protein
LIPIFHQRIEQIKFNSYEKENKIKSIKEKIKSLIKDIDNYTTNYYYWKLGNIEKDNLKSFIVYQKSKKNEKQIKLICSFEKGKNIFLILNYFKKTFKN